MELFKLFFLIMVKVKDLLIFAVLLLLYLLFNMVTGIGFICIFHELTGLYCPGCGVTRMLNSMLKLDFYQAYRFNPLLFFLSFFALFLFIDYIISIIFKRKSIYGKISSIFWYSLIVVLLLFGFLRNIIPYFAPTLV